METKIHFCNHLTQFFTSSYLTVIWKIERRNKTFVNAQEEEKFIHSECCLGTSVHIFVFKFIFCCLFLYRCYFVNLIRSKRNFLRKNYFILKLFTRVKTIFQSTKKTTWKEERKTLGSSFICCLGDWIFYGPML